MRKVRRKVLRHAKWKLYAVDACFLVLAVTATTKAIGMQRTIQTAVTTYASPTEEEVQTGEVEQYELPEEYRNLPEGYTAPTGYDLTEEELQERQEGVLVSSDEDEDRPWEKTLIKSRDWDEGDVLMQIAMAEAEGEPVEGKAMVMLVVLNRVWTEGFPDSISDVVFQPGQFTPVSNGRYYSVTPDEECREAYEMVLKGWDESQGALYFASTDYPHSWHTDNLEYLFTIGKHEFFK